MLLIEAKSAGFSAVVCHEYPGLTMVLCPLGPGIHPLMVSPHCRRVIRVRDGHVVGMVEKGGMVMMVSIVTMSVVMRNMTETMTCQSVTFISKIFINVNLFYFMSLVLPIIWIVLTWSSVYVVIRFLHCCRS